MATVSCGVASERIGFIKRHGIDLGITYLCQWLRASHCGYYARLKREPLLRTLNDKALVKKIIEIHSNNRGVYSSPRIHEAYEKQGESVHTIRVERLILQGRVVQVMRLKRFIERVKTYD